MGFYIFFGKKGIESMTLINTNVNGYWQQAGIYGQQTTSINAPASQAYKPNNTMPKMDMPSMLKIMLQMMKMLQGVQGPRYGQSQSTFNNAVSPYPQMNPADYGTKFLSPSPVATVPTPAAATVNSTAFLFAMLLSQSSGTTSILPNLVSTTPAPPTTTTPSPPETAELPIYTPPPPNEKVYIVGSYATGNLGIESTGYNALTLENNINDFSGVDTGTVSQWGGSPNTGVYSSHKYFDLQRGGTATDSNNKDFQELLSKISPADKKNLQFNQGQAYIISESGEILGTASSSQLGKQGKVSFWHSAPTIQANSNFQVVNGSLGLEDDGSNTLKSWSTNQESEGGQIILDGKTYDVASTILRKHSPLTFDLNSDGVKTSDKMIQYDIDGDGTVDNINDVADGVLSIRGGASGQDVFGNNTDLDGDGKADGFKNGFDALKALAVQEGLIDGKKDMVLDASDLALLEKKYQLAMKTAGYNSKNENLADLDISEINLGETDATQTAHNFDGQGNDLMTQEGSTFKLNGKTQDYADVWHLLK